MSDEPQRGPLDGPINVERVGEDIEIHVDHGNADFHLRMSEWNARRVFAALSLLLDLPLAPRVARRIQMGSNTIKVEDGDPK